MSEPLTLREAAPLLGCRDPRTARKRLAILGVPVAEYEGRLYVDRDEIERAVRAHARPLDPARGSTWPGGETLPEGVKLWDADAQQILGRRRVNAPARGGQGEPLPHHEATAARRGHGDPCSPRTRRRGA